MPVYIFPKLSEVLSTLGTRSNVIAWASIQTLESTLLGFGIAVIVGLSLGISIGTSKLVYRSFYPLLVAFNSIPKVAVIPILVIWLGVGKMPDIMIAFLIAFFPIVVNVSTGLATIEPELRDLFRSLGASKIELLKKVGLPHSMPSFFAALKVAITLSFIGAIISEMVAGERGIGYVMVVATSRFDTPLAFASLLVVAALGVILFSIFSLIDRYVASWAYR